MKWIIRLLKAGALLGVIGILAISAGYFYFAPQIPSIDGIREIRFQVPLRVYTRDGQLIQEFGEKRRVPVRYQELPERMIQAFLAAEDDRYFEHHGVDYQGLLAAVFEVVSTGERTRGGSTITMQVARNLFLSLEKTYERKLKEIILSFRIESELSKEEILELYLNKIFMGHRAYGVGAAAQVYYGKDLGELDLAQIAMIAGLPKAPSAFNPITNPERALQRRDYVLGRMNKLGFITPEEHQQAKERGVTAQLKHSRIEVKTPYVGEMVRNYMVERFGEEEAYTGGYSVITTIDPVLQPAADDAVRRALLEYDHRHGYRGPEGKADLTQAAEGDAGPRLPADYPPVADLLPAVVVKVDEKRFSARLGDGSDVVVEWEQMNWARPFINRNARGSAPKRAGDIVAVGDIVRLREILIEGPEGDDADTTATAWELSQVPEAEGAMVALDPQNGGIRALVGGYDYYNSKFNRAIQAKRQPGSGFKAIVYSAALARGYHPASLINDAPVVFDDVSLEDEWRPENYSGKFFGPTRLRVALVKSRNLVSIRLLRSLGVDNVLAHAARFGFDPEELPHNLSLALGSAVVSPLEMSRAYAVLANGGYRVEPYFIETIKDSQGELVYQARPLQVCPSCMAEIPPEPLPPLSRAAPRVIDAHNHYLMNSMLRDVVRAGTATRARSLGRDDLAGKTGTTNDQRDAWFNGFHPSLVANVWVGLDSNDQLGRGEVGGRAALPAWIYFMETALADVPEAPLRMPEGILQVRIDPHSGKRAYPGQPDATFEVFPADQVPSEQSGVRTPLSSEPLEATPEVPSAAESRPRDAPDSMEIF